MTMIVMTMIVMTMIEWKEFCD